MNAIEQWREFSNLERMNVLIEGCTWGVAFFIPFSLNAVTLFLASGTLLWLLKMFVEKKMLIKRTPFDIFIILYVFHKN